eukprot:GHUV01021158.1.p1 GENE.GHUV01021158.1~~GHUV01021158.1.p1  ORF type:complete len:126 (+),score=31.40 GHUV01021158.1:1436-1813(+)
MFMGLCWRARHSADSAPFVLGEWLRNAQLSDYGCCVPRFDPQDTLTSHYVEVLDVMIMYNPPLVFWGLWNSFKVLLPEATRNKVIMVDPADIKQLQDIVPQEVRAPVGVGGRGIARAVAVKHSSL